MVTSAVEQPPQGGALGHVGDEVHALAAPVGEAVLGLVVEGPGGPRLEVARPPVGHEHCVAVGGDGHAKGPLDPMSCASPGSLARTGWSATASVVKSSGVPSLPPRSVGRQAPAGRARAGGSAADRAGPGPGRV